jgi:hypothetical protein
MERKNTRKATTKGILPSLCGTICNKILEGCQGFLLPFLAGLFSSQFLRSSDSRFPVPLAEVGFYSGPVDGIWGRDSRAALRAFKEKSGLKNPEQWDKETQVHLFKGTSK